MNESVRRYDTSPARPGVTAKSASFPVSIATPFTLNPLVLHQPAKAVSRKL
jgi:hypothetical protein